MEENKNENLKEEEGLVYDDLVDDDEVEEKEKTSSKKATSKEDDEESHDENDEDKSKSDEEAQKKIKEERARYARMRREREEREKKSREEAIRKKAYIEGKLSQAKTNSFTNKPIKDEYDLEVYEMQLELESEGKDPNTDLAETIASLNRKKGTEAKEKAEKEKQENERIDKELSDFKKKYPKVDIAKLLNDQYFKEYSEGRLGVGGITLLQMYESFNKFKSQFASNDEKKEDKKSSEEDIKLPTPSSQSSGKSVKKQYSNMSEEEKIAYLRKQGLIR